jgi:dienelactone hydrolase
MKISRRQFELGAIAAVSTQAVRALAQPPKGVRQVPWLAEIQTPPPGSPGNAAQLPPLMVDAGGRRISTRDQWIQHRQTLRQAWLDLLGSWAPPRVAPQFEIQSSATVGRVSRQLISYETEPGVAVEAYLLTPLPARGRVPGVVVFHSTTDETIRQGAGLDGRPEAAWGLKLAERGFAAICPRAFLWDGTLPPNFEQRVDEHQKRHPDARGMAKMLFDGQRALDILAGLDNVDPERLAAAGHSLGAKETLYLAALDDRVKAAVFSEGGIGRTFSNWDAPWYLGKAPLNREHHELLAMMAPRPFLLIGGNAADGVQSWPYIAAAFEPYLLFGPPPRIGLFNHQKGHTIPPLTEQRVYEWLAAYL